MQKVWVGGGGRSCLGYFMFSSNGQGAGPGFLEREFIYMMVSGVRFADFISFLLKYPMKMK